MLLPLYYTATRLCTPLMPLYLRFRLRRGKEERTRLGERLGVASHIRPHGTLMWLHASSVGEANSLLPLIKRWAKKDEITLVLTTGTVTSARLMAERLPEGVVHQFAPVDTPQAVTRFLTHWQPDMVCFVESELWPNMLKKAHQRGCIMVLINARMSARSFARWRRIGEVIASILSYFSLILAQSESDAERFVALGAAHVRMEGNLKFAATVLPVEESAYHALKCAVGARPCWVAASVHPDEIASLQIAHTRILEETPNALLIIVPRHPEKGTLISRQFGEKTAQRSVGDTITADTHIYIADTLGELGLFYRLASIAFIGGSFIPHGGQNPLEAALLDNALLTGMHTHNFSAVWDMLLQEQAGAMMHDGAMLAEQVISLFTHPEQTAAMAANAKACVEAQQGVIERVATALQPLLEQARARA